MKIAIPISILVLKDKREFRLKRETGDRIQEALSKASQHLFIKVTELNTTFNSTEIKEVRNDVETRSEDPPEPPLTPEQVEKNKKIREEISRSFGKKI
jgi:hypothetical protein